MRKNISTATPSEKRVGYSRAVRINNRIYISGTVAMDESGQVQGANLYDQTVYILDKIRGVLEAEGFSENDIVETVVYIVDMSQLPQFDKVFHERFSNIKPTCTLVGVNKLISPEFLIEISATAEKS